MDKMIAITQTREIANLAIDQWPHGIGIRVLRPNVRKAVAAVQLIEQDSALVLRYWVESADLDIDRPPTGEIVLVDAGSN